MPKLSVSGLPAGLKYDAGTMTVHGKATKPGVYTVKVTATNASAAGRGAVVEEFALTVPNIASERLPNLLQDSDAYGTVQCGVAFDPGLVDCTPEEGWTVKAAGLPAGLKWNAKTGVITGVPTKAGVFTVTFTASKKGEANQIATITLATEALPAWAHGTFAGYVRALDGEPSGVEAHGLATMTVSANGKGSGDAALLNAVAGGWLGDSGTAEVLLWRNLWKDRFTAPAATAEIAKWEGAYTISAEDGGYLSLKVGRNGDVRATGKLADGTEISAAAPLMYRDGWDFFPFPAKSV